MAFIQGDSGANVLTGGIDSDIIWGLGGNDTITGNGGNDEIDAGDGVDTIAFTGSSTQYEFDMVVSTNTWRFEPNYQLHFTLSSFDLTASRDGNDVMNDVEYLQFSNGTAHWYDMPVYYTAAPATSSLETLDFYGGNSNDTMIGHAGTDVFLGGLGDDHFDGGVGFDYVEYDSFNSYITMPQVAGGVTVNLGAGTASGAWGNDTFTNVEGVFGSAYNDLLIGSNGADYLGGQGGDDVFYGAGGDDGFAGGTGLDWVVYFGNRSEYFVGTNPAARVVIDNVGTDGSDSLLDIERVQFADSGLAFDTNGNAGDAARIIGVLLGGEFVLDKNIENIVIGALDDGYTEEQFAAIAINVLYPNYTPSQLATLMYENVIGTTPTPNEVSTLVNAMAQTSPAYIAVYAGDTSYNDTNIDFTGLVAHGVPFAPLLV